MLLFCMQILTGCTQKKCETQTMEENDIYGTWYISKVALVSDMYTGTTQDGELEENIYDPEEYIGYELEYSAESFRLGNQAFEAPKYVISHPTVDEYNNAGRFQQPDIYQFIEDEKIEIYNINEYEWISEALIQQYEIQFEEQVNYMEYNFIPVGTQCVLLNKDVLLIGMWGKILVAYRV